MAISLRTRLFLIVAVVLAGAMAASSVLTRQATLVEVREVVTRSAPANEVSDGVAAAVQEKIGGARDLAAVGPILEASEKATGRPVLVIDTDRRHPCARPTRALPGPSSSAATSDGHLTLRIRDAGTRGDHRRSGGRRRRCCATSQRCGAWARCTCCRRPDLENVSLQERRGFPCGCWRRSRPPPSAWR